MNIERHTLDNGIRIVHLQTNAMVAHAGILLNTGSRDEREEENGLAHFIEHIIFKGTRRRKAYQVLSRLENVGGDLNAYTTKEETCVYASILPGHFERAMELFSDILFNSTFPEKEMAREKEVIQDEINGYLDTPFDQIFDDFEEQLFNDHPLGRNILGSYDRLQSFRREDVLAFIERNYRNEGTVICSVGPMEFSKMVRISDRYFSHSLWGNNPRPRVPVNGYTPSHKVTPRNGFQTHCILGNRAYPQGHRKQVAMAVLNNILGGPGMNSRLNLSIREKHGLTYHIESGYHPYTDTGIFEIYIGTDADTLDRALHLTSKELAKLRNTGLGTLQLQRARQQLKGQTAIAGESNLNIMFALGKGLLYRDEPETLDDLYRKIDEVNREDILEVANEILGLENMSYLIYKTPD